MKRIRRKEKNGCSSASTQKNNSQLLGMQREAKGRNKRDLKHRKDSLAWCKNNEFPNHH
jgi:hypothetical protein